MQASIIIKKKNVDIYFFYISPGPLVAYAILCHPRHHQRWQNQLETLGRLYNGGTIIRIVYTHKKISAHARTFIVRISALNGLEFLIFYFGAAAAAAAGLRNFCNTAY